MGLEASKSLISRNTPPQTTNQKMQTMSNQETIQSEIESAYERYRENKEREQIAHSSGSSKPVMVYSNPNFKPLPKPETRLVHQSQSKKKVLNPVYSQAPQLFLNKDPGSSYPDKFQSRFTDPETGGNYGDEEYQQQKVESMRGGSAMQSNKRGNRDTRAAEIYRAANILKSNTAQIYSNMPPQDKNFGRKFKDFYDNELKIDPENIRMVELLEKQQPKRVSFVGKGDQRGEGHTPANKKGPHPSQSMNNMPILKNPKNLYKIGSKPQTRIYSNPSFNRQAINTYNRQSNPLFKERDPMSHHSKTSLDPRLKFDSLMIAPKERITENLKDKIPTWKQIEEGETPLDEVYAYYDETFLPNSRNPNGHQRGMARADPQDIDEV